MNTEDLSRKVMDAANAVGKKTAELIEAGKVLYYIRETERDIEKIYCEIGEYVCKNQLDILDDDCVEKVSALQELTEKLQLLREAQAQAKGMKLCVSCQALQEKDAKYCSKCGNPLD